MFLVRPPAVYRRDTGPILIVGVCVCVWWGGAGPPGSRAKVATEARFPAPDVPEPNLTMKAVRQAFSDLARGIERSGAIYCPGRRRSTERVGGSGSVLGEWVPLVGQSVG